MDTTLEGNGGLLPDGILPDHAREWAPDGAVAPHVRALGRYFDTRDWWPGDVVLTRHSQPGFFSSQITRFQTIGGYAASDARWTHAAIYIGDDLSVCEAIVKLSLQWPFYRGRVQCSELFGYVGKHAVRVRRSTEIHALECASLNRAPVPARTIRFTSSG